MTWLKDSNTHCNKPSHDKSKPGQERVVMFVYDKNGIPIYPGDTLKCFILLVQEEEEEESITCISLLKE